MSAGVQPLSCPLLALLVLLVLQKDLQVSACDKDCEDAPSFSPSRLVVRFGDPASARCTVCQSCGEPGLEKSLGTFNITDTEIVWIVDSVNDWQPNLLCHYTKEPGRQCCRNLPVFVYQPPENISLTFLPWPGRMTEGQSYTLECSVKNIAALNFTVNFYRGRTEVGSYAGNHQTSEPFSQTFRHPVLVRKEDDGARYSCGVTLDLGPEGPQPPPANRSDPVAVSVHYKPRIRGAPPPNPIGVQRRDSLSLNCSAEGNPPPSYSWTLPVATASFNGSVLALDAVDAEQSGHYVCTVSNPVGTVDRRFHVQVQGDQMYLIVVLAVAALAAVFLVSVCVCLYRRGRTGHYNLSDVFHLARRRPASPGRHAVPPSLVGETKAMAHLTPSTQAEY